MRRAVVILTGLALFLARTGSVYAEDTVDALEKDLQDIKETHQTTSAAALSDFLAQTLTASQSPDAALDLYQKSGGTLPNGSPIQSQHARETTQEKEAREAQDATLYANLANIAQLHCGMLHYAVLFATTPDQKGLHDDWVAWLKGMPSIFTQLKDDDMRQTRMLKKMTMKESVIGTAFNFYGWGEKAQGGWSVNDLPEMYHTEVLEPLRATPTADTLTAWDTYIALKSATEPDSNKWNVVELPALMFDRGNDDYTISPTMDKLQVLVDLIKANPTCPTLDDMISRVHDLVKDYRKRHPSATAPSADTATASTTSTNAAPDSNVKVTKDGDMTIITTSTNAAASTPPATPPQ